MTPVFDSYAAYYDLLYRDKDYAGETAYIDELIRKHVPTATNILELGCGTGIHARHLAKLGYDLHCIDLSEKMLSGAQMQTGKLGRPEHGALEFALGDVRNYRIDRKFDVVISLFHVLSYQTSNHDVAASIATAAVHLEQGGILIMDFWYGPAVLESRPETRAKHLEDDLIRLTRIAEPACDPNENTVDVNYLILVENKQSNHLERLVETHRMRYFFKPELEQFLENAGFESLGIHEWLTQKPATDKSWSSVLIARRRR